MTALTSGILAAMLGAAGPASATAALNYYGAYVSGSIENTGCAIGSNTGNCLFAGVNPNVGNSYFPGPNSSAPISTSLGDGYASISGAASLVSGALSLSATVTGAPNSGGTDPGNPAGVAAVIYDTLIFSSTSAAPISVTVHMSGAGSVTGAGSGLNYGINLQQSGPNIAYFFPATPLSPGSYNISQTFTVTPNVAYELDVGLRITVAGDFHTGSAILFDPLSITLPDGAGFTSSSGLFLTQSEVPEPAGMAMLAVGLLGLLGARMAGRRMGAAPARC